MIRTSTGFLALAVLAASCGVSRADLITYTETSTASGFVGGSTFTNVQITFSGTADTSSVSSVGGVYSVFLTAPEVTIAGLGTFSITDAVQEYDNQNDSVLGVTDSANGGGIGLLNASVFNTYDLMTSIGPVSARSSSSENFFATSSGDFHISRISTSGSFTASPSAVPEPASIMLMAMGLGGVLSAGRAARNRRERPLSSEPPTDAFQGTNSDR